MEIIEIQISKLEQDRQIDLRKRAEVDRRWQDFLDDNKSGKIVIDFKAGKCFRLAINEDILYDACKE